MKGDVIVRKTLLTSVLAFLMILVSVQSNQASAADYYIGTNPDGTEAYLVTESVRETMLSSNGYWSGYKYDCTVKSVYPESRKYYRDEYTFYCWSQGMPGWHKNGQRVSRQEIWSKRDNGSIEWALYEFFWDYSRKLHPDQWSR